MMYNKAELTAMQMIAGKLNWHKPAVETIETICQMVKNQQALELDTIGECDDFEETLLSIALWDKEKITSTMYVSDYCSLSEWHWNCMCEDLGVTNEDFCAMMHWYNIKDDILIPEYEMEEEYARLDALYNDMEIEELHYWQHARMMGWE